VLSARAGVIWVGTSNGLVKMTRNGGLTWSDVSIPGIHDSSFATVSNVEASHTDPAEAYAAIDLHRLGDYTRCSTGRGTTASPGPGSFGPPHR